MTMKLPQKAGFVPTVQEWDQLVRIAESLAAQLAQAQADRDKARADAALLTDNVNDLGDAIGTALIYASGKTEQILRRALGDDDAALRQPAPERLRDGGTCECGHWRGQHRADQVCMIFPCTCVKYTAPAPAQGQE